MALVALSSTRALSLLIALPLWAQLIYNPHSGYGLGLSQLTAAGAGLGMGRLSTVGIGISLPEQPAHSAHLPAMQADFSGYGRSSLLQTATSRGRFGTGGLQNLQLSFARGKGWGFALGLAPQLYQGYLSTWQTNDPVPLRYTEKAEGLFTLAYLQTALRWKHLAIGYQLGYAWGTYDRQRNLQSAAQSLPDYLISQIRMEGLQHRIGTLWQDSINTTAYQISLVYAWPTSLNREVTYLLQKNFSFTNILLDTLALLQDRWRYVGQLRIGLLTERRKWRIGIEGGYSPPAPSWGGPGLVEAQGQTAWDLRAGAEWLPDPRSAAFYKRMRYQIGGFIAQPPYASVRQYGLTTGIGWQFPRSPNLILLAIEQGWLPHSSVRERYLQVSLAVVFRELWFIPPKID